MLKISKRHLLILFLVPFILCALLLSRNYVFGGAEEGLPFYNVANTLNLYSNLWVDDIPGYPAVFQISMLPLLSVLYIAWLLTLSSSLTSCIYIFTFMFSGVIGIYLLSLLFFRNLKNKENLSLIAALFYLLNPYTLSQIWGRHLSMQFFPFALFPLFLYFFALGLSQKNLKLGFIGVIFSVFFAGAFSNISYLFSLFIMVALYSLIYLVTQKDNFWQVIKYLFILGITFLIFHSWWLVQFFSTYSSTGDFNIYISNLESATGVSQFFPFNILVRLQQKYYFYDIKAFGDTYASFAFQIISYLIPLITFLGFTQLKKLNKNIKFFLIVLFIGAFLFCLGTNPPLGRIFYFALKKIPLLQMYRNPYEKFGLVLLIPYSLIFALGFIKLFSKRVLQIFASLILFGVYMYPLWNGSVFRHEEETVTPPADYTLLNNFLNTNATDSRVMFLPIVPGDAINYKWDNKQYRGIEPAPFIFDRPFISRELEGNPQITQYINAFRTNLLFGDVRNAMDKMRIKYAVYHKDSNSSPELHNQVSLLKDFNNPPTYKGIQLCNWNKDKAKLIATEFLKCNLQTLDLTQIKYLILDIETDKEVAIELRLFDTSDSLLRWDGKLHKPFRTPLGKSQIIFPFGLESERYKNFDISKVLKLEVTFFAPNEDNANVYLNSLIADSGKKVQTGYIHRVSELPQHVIYEKKSAQIPALVSIPSKLIPLETTSDYFKMPLVQTSESVYINSQNAKRITEESQIQNIITNYICRKNICYLSVESSNSAPIVFYKSYDPNWILVAGVTRRDGLSSILSDIEIISSSPNANHFISDGYANGWFAQGDTSYVIAYRPAVFYRIFLLFSSIFLGLILVFYVITNRWKNH